MSPRVLVLALILVPIASDNALAQVTTEGERVSQPAVESAPSASESRIGWTITERVRYSGLSNQFRPGFSGDDRALVFRTTLQAEFTSRAVTIGGEIQDARAYLTHAQSNVSTALVNPVDLLQAYVRVGGRTTASRLPDVQIGRFTMELGSGRLIAQEAWRDVARAFTGTKVRWRPDTTGLVTAFGVFPVATLPDTREALLHNRMAADRELWNQTFWGALYERDRLWRRTRGEAYVYRLREHDVAGRKTRDRRLWTAGIRVYRAASVGAWDVEVESVWQRGRVHASGVLSDSRPLDVSARLLHAHAGRTFAGPWSPRVGVEYDYGSGDRDPTDGQWNRFDGLFGSRRTELGPTGIYGALGRENIETMGVRLSLVPTSRIDAFAVYRALWLAAAADAFASTGVRDADGRSGRNAGHQIDVRVRAWVVPAGLRLEIGVTQLIKGPFLRRAPNAPRDEDTTFVYGDLTYAVGAKAGATR
jgi:hypothetical protein